VALGTLDEVPILPMVAVDRAEVEDPVVAGGEGGLQGAAGLLALMGEVEGLPGRPPQPATRISLQARVNHSGWKTCVSPQHLTR
jgi:hypothetical protein